MEETIALIKAISYILWPICLLLIVFIFRKEIRTVLHSLVKKQSEKMVENPPETQIPAPTIERHVTVIPKPVTTKTTSNEQLTVEACKINQSGKYSIILNENNDKFHAIAPNGNIDWFSKKLFDTEIEDITVDLLDEEQREKFYWWIQNTKPVKSNSGNIKKQPIDGYLPGYMRLLNNPDTEPSRMLRYIQSKGKVTWFEVKQYLHDTYWYSLTSGSMGASLKALETLGLVTINGQGDDKIITSNFSSKRQNHNRQFIEST